MDKEKAMERIAAIEEEAKGLREIIDAPEKPKLQHGDYGFRNRHPRFFAQENDTLKVAGCVRLYLSTGNTEDYDIFGNITDDLERYRRPFETTTTPQVTVRRLDPFVSLEHSYPSTHLTSDNAIELGKTLMHAAIQLKLEKGK